MFTGEPTAAEDAANWLAALETNMYPSNTSREKAELFSTKLFPKSTAKHWLMSYRKTFAVGGTSSNPNSSRDGVPVPPPALSHKFPLSPSLYPLHLSFLPRPFLLLPLFLPPLLILSFRNPHHHLHLLLHRTRYISPETPSIGCSRMLTETVPRKVSRGGLQTPPRNSMPRMRRRLKGPSQISSNMKRSGATRNTTAFSSSVVLLGFRTNANMMSLLTNSRLTLACKLTYFLTMTPSSPRLQSMFHYHPWIH